MQWRRDHAGMMDLPITVRSSPISPLCARSSLDRNTLIGHFEDSVGNNGLATYHIRKKPMSQPTPGLNSADKKLTGNG